MGRAEYILARLVRAPVCHAHPDRKADAEYGEGAGKRFRAD